ncbi:Putative ammonia monooxygenase [Halomonas sp. THAF5a]|uniref:AbrB family transcriptional regulator n=1 Tax=Halomonas sp. THAF5a TaxID=2587844 RepID=UPI001267F73D|nr:AbrB family transcriptional regulator [Halomonas sp. THAF5a]QFU02884.1 Putative ammonia monooxygenase [Halomonas sp. THAF5a]
MSIDLKPDRPRAALAFWWQSFLLPGGIALVGGGVWNALGLPLGWLLGAAIATGIWAGIGRPARAPKPIQRTGLLVVGASVGLWITPEVARQLLGWLPVMLASAALGVALAILVTPLYARLSGLDKATAYFCLLPGGVIEMAEIGEGYRANRAAIAALHATRVGLIVTLLPAALFVISATPSMTPAEAAQPPLDMVTLAALLVLCAAVSGGAGRLRMPSAWFLTPLVVAGGLAGSQVLPSAPIPQEILVIAQVVVGFNLGAKFQQATLRMLPKAIATGVPVLMLIGLVAAMAALAVTGVSSSGESPATLVLGFSVGGMAEMTLTAQALGQNAALVAGFHAIRALSVNLFAGPLWGRLSRLPGFQDSPHA